MRSKTEFLLNYGFIALVYITHIISGAFVVYHWPFSNYSMYTQTNDFENSYVLFYEHIYSDGSTAPLRNKVLDQLNKQFPMSRDDWDRLKLSLRAECRFPEPHFRDQILKYRFVHLDQIPGFMEGAKIRLLLTRVLIREGSPMSSIVEDSIEISREGCEQNGQAI